MADKVSTLRFRVEGTPEVQSKIQELEKAITRQQRQLAQSVKAASQAPVDSTEKYDAAKRAQKDAEQLGRLHAMRKNEQDEQIKEELANAHNGLNALQRAKEDAAFKEFLFEERRAKAKTKIASAELDEQSRLLKQKYSAENGNAMSGFGGKMILGMAAGQVAGDVTGDASAGSAVGSVVSAAMFGGPAMGVAVAGLEVVGMAFKGQRAAAEASRKAVTDYTNTLLSMGSTWRNLAVSMIQQSPFGDAMDKEFQRASASAVKYQQDLAKHLMLPPTAEDTVQAYINVMRGMPLVQAAQNTPYALTASGLKDQSDLEKTMAETARKERDKEYPKQVADQQRLNQVEKDRLAAASMMPGYLKKQAELTADVRQQQEKLIVAHAQQIRQQEAAEAMARTMAREALDRAMFRPLGTTQAEADALTAASGKAAQDLNDVLDAGERLNVQQAMETSQLYAKTIAQGDAFDIQQKMMANEEKGQALDRSRQASAANILNIYEKQRAELANRHETEMRQARANPATASTVDKLAIAQAAETEQLEVGIAQDKEEKILQTKASADQVEISLDRNNFRRSANELERRFAEELRLYDKYIGDVAGRNELLRQQENERKKQQQDTRIWVQEKLDAIDPKRSFAKNRENEELMYLRRKGQMGEEGGIAEEQYQKLMHRFDFPLEQKAKREDIESAYKMHGIGYKDYKIQSLKLDNPNASDEAINRLYESERRKDMAEHWGDFRRQSFSSDYAPGRVDFKALAGGGNVNNQIDATRQGNEWLRQIYHAISQQTGLH